MSPRSVEDEIEMLIERRASKEEESPANLQAAAWRKSAEKYYRAQQRIVLQDRRDYHLRQVNSLESTMDSLIHGHREAAKRIDEMLSGRAPLPPLNITHMCNTGVEIL